MIFSQELVRLRKLRGLTQEQVAEAVGVSRQAVAKWESGENLPDLEKLIQISALFRVSLDSLLKGERPCSTPAEGSPALPGDLRDFLCRAKKATYAGRGAEVAPCRPESHDLCYEEGDLRYYDSFLGSHRFSGEEAVWRSGVPQWCMNYTGRILDERFPGDFLKDCLALVSREAPFRGPAIHSSGDCAYHCTVRGDLLWFHGEEVIYNRGRKVYECLFHGGEVQE